MKRTIAFVTAIILCAAGSAYAVYEVSDKGDWPTTWPRELEPLRKQARTLVGPQRLSRHYAIPFAKREEFESAWPQLLKVKSKGAAIILVHAPNFFLGDSKAGVVVHAPPAGQEENPATGDTTYIELVVDGTIVDLNRIPLPPDTPIIDRRFDDGQSK